MSGGTAIVLFNLGGPDRLTAVEPFLYNLFRDPAIIRLPDPFRWALAKFISRRRAPLSREMYAAIGGGSPLVPLTRAQGEALKAALGDLGRVEVTLAMRYWHPFADEAVQAVKRFDPDRIVLLPLYPQYSTTTSASSLKDWHRAARAAGLNKPTVSVCCYPREAGFIGAQARLVTAGLAEAEAQVPGRRPRVLFSAHGLPKKIVDDGDPYQVHVETTARAIAEAAGIDAADYVVCYQSKVGRLEWLGPDTEHEIHRCGSDGVAAVVVPIAFVSEHSETLFELDIDYRAKAEAAGVPAYVRVPAVGTEPEFIAGLARLVRDACGSAASDMVSAEGGRFCPATCRRCAMAEKGL
jgi:ferrochelatase